MTKRFVFIIVVAGFIIFGFNIQATASSDLEYDNHTQVSRKRISRFVYEFSFTVTVINHGTDADAVKAICSINSPHTTIIDAEVDFGFLSAGKTVTSTDTYTIRHDRRYPFDTEAVTWSFFSLPLDPGEKGKETLLGIDSDNDGVRDDIQRYIYLTYPNEKIVRLALSQIARNYQELLPDSSDPEIAYENVKKLNRSRACLHYVKDNDIYKVIKIRRAIKAELLNTQERSLKYLEFNNSLAGRTATLPSFEEQESCCLFDVNNLGGTQ